MAENKDFIVDGFIFGTQEDADLAQKEKKRIERIDEKMDYDDSQTIIAVLNKAIDSRVFKTPIGYEFLRKLQKAAKNNPPKGDSQYVDEIPDIPVYGTFSLRESDVIVAKKVTPSTKKPPKQKQEAFSRKTSVILNVILFVLVIVMFFITLNGSSPNILNYERALQNRYAAWEKELSDREAVIRDKEKELLINE
jgi:hypothetical protein